MILEQYKVGTVFKYWSVKSENKYTICTILKIIDDKYIYVEHKQYRDGVLFEEDRRNISYPASGDILVYSLKNIPKEKL